MYSQPRPLSKSQLRPELELRSRRPPSRDDNAGASSRTHWTEDPSILMYSNVMRTDCPPTTNPRRNYKRVTISPITDEGEFVYPHFHGTGLGKPCYYIEQNDAGEEGVIALPVEGTNPGQPPFARFCIHWSRTVCSNVSKNLSVFFSGDPSKPLGFSLRIDIPSTWVEGRTYGHSFRHMEEPEPIYLSESTLTKDILRGLSHDEMTDEEMGMLYGKRIVKALRELDELVEWFDARRKSSPKKVTDEENEEADRRRELKRLYDTIDERKRPPLDHEEMTDEEMVEAYGENWAKALRELDEMVKEVDAGGTDRAEEDGGEHTTNAIRELDETVEVIEAYETASPGEDRDEHMADALRESDEIVEEIETSVTAAPREDADDHMADVPGRLDDIANDLEGHGTAVPEEDEQDLLDGILQNLAELESGALLTGILHRNRR